MNKDQLQDRLNIIQSQFDSNTQTINDLNAEQNRLQGEYRLLQDLLKEPEEPKEVEKEED